MKIIEQWKVPITSLLVILTMGASVLLPGIAHALATGSIQSWQTTTALPDIRIFATSVVSNGYIYELGGYDNSFTPTDTVYYAPLNSDGTVGTWQTTTALPDSLNAATSVVSNGYIYELGGYDNSSRTDTVYYAPLNSDGTVGAWQTTTALPDSLDVATSVVSNGYIYELGGYDNSSRTDTIYYAPLNSDGTIGAWQTTTSLPDSLDAATSVVSNGYVYELGGADNTDNIDTVYYAPLNSDGTVGAWQTTTSLPDSRIFATSVVSNGYVYEIGGANNSFAPTDTVYYAPLNSDGTVGAWQTTTALPANLNDATSVVSNGYVYEIGGANNGGNTDTVYYGEITAPPSNSSSTSSTTTTTSSSSDPAPDTGYGSPSTTNLLTTILIASAIVSTGLGLTLLYHNKRTTAIKQ